MDGSAVAVRERLLAELVADEREIAFRQARQQRVLAELAGHRLPGELESADKEWVREEVACALRVTSGTAGFRMERAVSAVSRMPGVVKLLEAGEITLRHVWTLAEASTGLDDVNRPGMSGDSITGGSSYGTSLEVPA